MDMPNMISPYVALENPNSLIKTNDDEAKNTNSTQKDADDRAE